MRKLLFIIVLLITASMLFGQYLIRDAGGEPVPYLGTRWEARTVAAADTSWQKVMIPADCYEITMQATAGIRVAADSLYSTELHEFAITDTTATVTLPVHNMVTMWIRRASAGTAASLKMLFRKW